MPVVNDKRNCFQFLIKIIVCSESVGLLTLPVILYLGHSPPLFACRLWHPVTVSWDCVLNSRKVKYLMLIVFCLCFSWLNAGQHFEGVTSTFATIKLLNNKIAGCKYMRICFIFICMSASFFRYSLIHFCILLFLYIFFLK